MVLSQFSPPGNVTDLSEGGRAAWSRDVQADFDELSTQRHPQFFSPLVVDLAPDAANKSMGWGAFPRKLARQPAPRRWQLGERRDLQEEYCEWAAQRDRNNRILQAFFTTEVPSYYHRLNNDNEEQLLALYRDLVGPDVRLRDLQLSDGSYKPDNRWNRDGAVHMIQVNNTLGAAITLVAHASVVRINPDGELITNANDLIECGIAADGDRNSDPLIVTDVNALARTGAHVTLTDPVGLHIDRLHTAGWATPDGSDPMTYWTITRGSPGHGVRGVYAVPEDAGFTVSDITINGQPIESPSQIAEHLQIRITGTAHLGQNPPEKRPCGASRGSGSLESLADAEPPSMAQLIQASQSMRG